MKIYVIRHGETDWNKERRIQGQSNTNLNDYGRELAEKTREGLKDVKFDYVFSSPLDRAHETALIICKGRDINVECDDRLKEICFGEYEGTTKEDRDPSFNAFFKAPGEFVPAKGGESIDELLIRTKDFIDSVLVPISQKHPDATVMVVGHGAMNKALMCNMNNLSKEHLWDGAITKNCSVSIYETFDKGFKVLEDGLLFY